MLDLEPRLDWMLSPWLITLLPATLNILIL